ncbi:hypothetical protein [Facklamia miroungae]|uniref:Uncharacterized protein n=1 Tax=Facklamia miroungae TaxID=120956 RepID=A0A1G7P042_9LACT|nr:hypothetical protein [Facklamia miroungae]NKZ28535.1 hypothetical protein [Facklamia miroungae]SDF79672.1 hypothetical protein SAMN05421791_10176 [Facklamia miroungae]
MVKFSIEFEDNEELLEAFQKVPNKAEKVTNNFLESKGAPEAMRAIIGLMPVSRVSKRHAKDSSSLKQKMENLGFEIMPKKKFNYLVFPNDGVGSKNLKEQIFFQLGLKQVEGSITIQLTDVLLKAAEL